MTPTMEITVSGNKYTISSDSGVKAANIEFTLNEEFDDPMPTGVVLKSVATLEGNVLKITSKTDGKRGVRTYEFTDTQCILVSFTVILLLKKMYITFYFSFRK